MQRIAQQQLKAILANLIASALGFISFLILQRHLNTNEFGLWLIYGSATSLFNIFRFGLSHSATIKYYVAGSNKEKKSIEAAHFLISLCLTFFIAILLLLADIAADNIELAKNYRLFFQWYPWLALANLPSNCAITTFIARQQFGRILAIRTFSAACFSLFVGIYSYSTHIVLDAIFLVHISINAFISLVVLYLKIDKEQFTLSTSMQTIKKLLSFGKYSIIAETGKNLTRNTDTFIISIFPLFGAKGVALIGIPLKFIELINMVYAALSDAAFPRLSQCGIAENKQSVKSVFREYIRAVIFLLAPISIFGFIYANQIMLLLAGEQYIAHNQELVVLFKICLLMAFVLPFDSFATILFNSLNRPKLVVEKTIIFLIFNISFDVMALYYFQSLAALLIGNVLALSIALLYSYLKYRRIAAF